MRTMSINRGYRSGKGRSTKSACFFSCDSRALCLAAWLLGAAPGLAENDSFGAASADAADTNSTVITSTRLTYDQQKQTAIFEDQVVVTDPRVKINADKLTVLLTKDNHVMAIEAEGSVVIQEGEKIAIGEKARYEVDEGKFILSGHPTVQNGRDLLSAEKITFWRDTNRIQCEENIRMTIRSEQGGMKSNLLKKE